MSNQDLKDHHSKDQLETLDWDADHKESVRGTIFNIMQPLTVKLFRQALNVWDNLVYSEFKFVLRCNVYIHTMYIYKMLSWIL